MNCLSCLFVAHFSSALRTVQFGLAISVSQGPNLSLKNQPVQRYMSFGNTENKNFTDFESVIACVEVLYTFAGTALDNTHDLWSYVDFHDKEKFFFKIVGFVLQLELMMLN